MTKPAWMTSLEDLAAELRENAQARRAITPTDMVADALDSVAAKVDRRIHVLQEPTRILTAEEWGAEQEKPVTGKTVRRWYHRGELPDAQMTPGGIRIPATARRRVPAEGEVTTLAAAS